MTKKQKLLLVDFVMLYQKIVNKETLNNYDFRLLEIIEEYDFLIDFRKELKK